MNVAFNITKLKLFVSVQHLFRVTTTETWDNSKDFQGDLRRNNLNF